MTTLDLKSLSLSIGFEIFAYMQGIYPPKYVYVRVLKRLPFKSQRTQLMLFEPFNFSVCLCSNEKNTHALDSIFLVHNMYKLVQIVFLESVFNFLVMK